MNRSLHLTEAERQKIGSLASDVVRERCRKDSQFLLSIVAKYVGEAQLAQEAVLEQCKNDPEHLGAVVNDYLSGQNAFAQVRLLEDCLGQSGVVGRLGFDPFDPERERAYKRASRFVNNERQMAVLLLGVVVMALMCLFPPWKKNDWRTQWAFLIWSSHVENSEFAGYHFAFAEMPGPPSFSALDGQQRHTTYSWHVGLLLLQWLIWSLVIAGLCIALRDRKTFEQRLAEVVTKSDGRG
jgi:hypothetical protein